MFDPNDPPRLAMRLRPALRAAGFDEDLPLKAIRDLQARGYFPPHFPLTDDPNAPLVVRWDALVAIIERQEAVGLEMEKIAAAKRRARTQAATLSSARAKARRKAAATAATAQSSVASEDEGAEINIAASSARGDE
jgi:hypothetical protein